MTVLRRLALSSVLLALIFSPFLIPSQGLALSADHLLISEVMYDPAAPEPEGEWVEVYAPAGVTVSLGGWRVADNTAADTLPAVLIGPGEYAVIAADESAFRQAYPGFAGKLIHLGGPIGNGLANGGDRVLLLDPGGATVDAMSYGSDAAAFDPPCPDVPEGQSLARTAAPDTDTAADWMPQASPNPGAAAVAPTPAPTHSATPTRTPTRTPTVQPTRTATATFISTATPTPSPALTATATPTPPPTSLPTASVTASVTAGATPARLLISEVLYDASVAGTEVDFEWLELFNPNDFAVHLSGWKLEDNTSADTLPDYMLAPGEHLVVAASAATFYATYPAFSGSLVSLEGPIGNGLSNSGDRLRLLAPAGALVDAVSYGSDTSAFDPACPPVGPGESLARVPSGADSDTASDWQRQATPNPGAAGVLPVSTATAPPTAAPTATLTPAATATVAATATPTLGPTTTLTPAPTATPTLSATATVSATATPIPQGIFLNELLPDPRTVDWDSDGQPGWLDEWIELYNAADVPASLGGWALHDATTAYTITQGTIIWPHSYLLLFRRQTGLALGDWRDEVRLVRPDGVVADHMAYDYTPDPDRSYCRSEDGGGYWTKECEVTPGRANQLTPKRVQPAATPAPAWPTGAATLADVRTAPHDTRVTVTGVVVLPPGLFAHSLYLQDATAGLKVYLRSGEFPAVKVGDRLQVTGWTRLYEDEPELSVPDPGYIVHLGAGAAPAPLYLRTGKAVPAHGGQLVLVAGRVLRYERQALVLDDGSGPLRVYFPEGLGWRRPYVQIGQMWSAQGVLVRNPFDGPAGSLELVPRMRTDISDAPLTMPVTGGDVQP